jgi:hypothetical protein
MASEGSRPGSSQGADGYPAPAEVPEPLPLPKPNKISLQLALKNSFTKAELGDYDQLSAEEVYEKALQLKTLHLEWQHIAEMANLEPFENVEVLYMQYNRIERIEGLDFMPKLQFLALQHNRIEFLENLRHLSELEFLDLSGNLISDLDVAELPRKLGILNLLENPCTAEQGYKERILAKLPDLAYLDKVQLVDDGDHGAAGGSSGSALAGCLADEQQLSAGEKGLGAYYRKDELQTGLAANIKDQIEAYGTESLADADGFSRRIDSAVKRSEDRRKNLEEQLTVVKRAMARADANAHTPTTATAST